MCTSANQCVNSCNESFTHVEYFLTNKFLSWIFLSHAQLLESVSRAVLLLAFHMLSLLRHISQCNVEQK